MIIIPIAFLPQDSFTALPLFKAQLSGNSTCRWKHKNRRNSNHKNSFGWRAEIIPTKCMEVHFSQRLILGEWSWSLHRATEKVATVPVYKSKNGGKTKCIKKIPSVSWCTQPVSATKMDEKTKEWQSILQWRSSYGRLNLWSFPHLRQRSACRVITAQQCAWWLKGGEGGVRKGRNGGGEAVGPALPALGPALAGNCNSSSGGKVSSAWLPLASPKCLPLCSRLYPQTFRLTQVFFCFEALPLLLCTIFYL